MLSQRSKYWQLTEEPLLCLKKDNTPQQNTPSRITHQPDNWGQCTSPIDRHRWSRTNLREMEKLLKLGMKQTRGLIFFFFFCQIKLFNVKMFTQNSSVHHVLIVSSANTNRMSALHLKKQTESPIALCACRLGQHWHKLYSLSITNHVA